MPRDEIWQTATTHVPSFDTCKSLWDHGIRLTKTTGVYLSHGDRTKYNLEFWFPDGIIQRAYKGEDIGWHAYPAPFAQDIYKFLKTINSFAINIDINNGYTIISVMAYRGFHRRYTIEDINFAEQFALIAIDIVAEQGLLEEATPIEKP